MIDTRDKPLNPGFTTTLDLLGVLDLRTGDKLIDAVRCSLLGQAAHTQQTQGGRWIAYSRRREWYASSKAAYLDGSLLSFATVTRTVDAFSQADLIDHEKAVSCIGGSGFQSRFRLRAAPGVLPAAVPVRQVGPPLVMRAADGLPRPMPDTDLTHRMRRQIEFINDALRGIEIGGPHVTGQVINCGDCRRIWCGDIVLRRVFNGSINQGGRAYGAFQNAPKTIRATFTLKGASVERNDWSCLHPRLLYAQAGTALPDDVDLYDGCGRGGDAWRTVVKRAVQVLINANSDRQKYYAISRIVAAHHGDDVAATESAHWPTRNTGWLRVIDAHGKQAAALIDQIKARHRRIEQFFGTGAGLRLQRLDSDMMLRVTAELLREGIPVLPVHDEIIGPKSYSGRIKQRMGVALQRTMDKLRGGMV